MKIPDSYPQGHYPDGYESYIEYLCFYDNCLLIQPPFVPFWVRTLLDSLDLIGPETDADLEHIVAFVLEEPTYKRLHRVHPTIRGKIRAARGADYWRDTTPLGSKYGVITYILDGLIAEPFNDGEWMVCFSCYAMLVFDLDATKRAILDERIKVALVNFEPHGS